MHLPLKFANCVVSYVHMVYVDHKYRCTFLLDAQLFDYKKKQYLYNSCGSLGLSQLLPNPKLSAPDSAARNSRIRKKNDRY